MTATDIGGRVAANTSVLMVADVLGKLIGAAFVLYVARAVGVQQYGMYTLAGTVYVFLEFMARFGIGGMAVREVARNRDKVEGVVSAVLILLLGGAIIVYALLLLGLPFLHYDAEVKTLICLMALSLFPAAIAHTFTQTCFGLERMKLPSAIAIASSLVSSSLGILVLHLGYGLNALVGAIVLVGAGQAMIAGWFIRKQFLTSGIKIDPACWIPLIRYSLPFGVVTLLLMIHSKVDILMLSMLPGPLGGLEAIGLYTPAYSILGALMLLPSSLRSAMVPALAAHEGSLQAMRSTLEGTTKFLLAFVSFPLIIATTFFAEEIIGLLYGPAYLPGVNALRILGCAYALYAATIPAFSVLSLSRQLWRYVPWLLGIVLLNVVLNCFLIPTYSFLGASVATLITETVAWLLRLRFLRQMVGIEFTDSQVLRRLLAPMGSTLGVVWCLDWILHPHFLLLAPMVMVIYLVALVAFRSFSWEEMAMVKALWGT
jgi:O-antigen/teichoic acid export membrane protein